MKRKLFLLTIISVQFAICSAALATDTAKSPDTASIIAEYCAGMKQNYEAIKDASMVVDWTQTESHRADRQIAKVSFISPNVFLGEMHNAPASGGAAKVDPETHYVYTDGRTVTTLYTHRATKANYLGYLKEASGKSIDLGEFTIVDIRRIWGAEGKYHWDLLQKVSPDLVQAKDEEHFGVKGLGLLFRRQSGKTLSSTYFWIDKSHGFIQRIEEVTCTNSDDPKQNVSQNVYVDSVQSSGGVWFPKSISSTMRLPGSSKGSITHKILISNLKINSGINPKALVIKFPTDTRVIDEVSKKKYVVGKR